MSIINYYYLNSVSILQSTGHLIRWTDTAIDAILKESETFLNQKSSVIQIRISEPDEQIKLKHLSFFIFIFPICLITSFFALILEIFISNKNFLKLFVSEQL